MASATYLLPSGVRVTRKGYRQWRKDEGLCVQCDQPIAAPRSRSRCETHLMSASNAAMGYRTGTGQNGGRGT